ncbi:hypothetical protein [Arenimonas daejeonensis]|uniref:hypothetical protein n=1 Tax=Arenimonas daejeonensis TaxID=370777 RepID=UPI0011BF066B|nr:hypothetical protein [Arenimonas daejeonensis]
MAWTEALTIAAVLLLSAWLAGRAPLPARIVLWTSVFLVSAAMFLPSSTLYSIFGKDRVGAIARGTAHLPWT